MNRRFAKGVMTVLFAMGMSMAFTAPVHASAEAETCNDKPTGKVPVLLVHGWNGRISSMSATSKIIDKTDGVSRYVFDYEPVHDQWVTDSSIGRALAERIDCLSRASRKSKAEGKVIECRLPKGSFYYEVGCQFLDSSGKITKTIEHFLEWVNNVNETEKRI